MQLMDYFPASNTTSTRHTLQLHMSHIQTDMRDVAFYFKKKSGLPKLKDSGMADVLLGGEGLSVSWHSLVVSPNAYYGF